MTPAEIIDEVLVELSRPDFVRKAQAVFAEVVKSVHSINNLSRDLKTAYILDPNIINDRATFSVRQDLPGFRSLRGIRVFKSYTVDVQDNVIPSNELLEGIKFQKGATNLELRDYYGFRNRYIYSIVGDVGTITGVDALSTCIEILYLSYPTITIDPVTTELSTNSWIVEDHPELVKAALAARLAQLTSSPELINIFGTILNQLKIEFIDQHLNEILGET